MKSLEQLELQGHELLHRLRGSGLGEDSVALAKKVLSQLFANAKPLIVAEAQQLVVQAAAQANHTVGGGIAGQVAEDVVSEILSTTASTGLAKVEDALGDGSEKKDPPAGSEEQAGGGAPTP